MNQTSGKVVCYLVHREHLLVFTHDEHDLLHTGLQVPAGSIKAGESPAEAAVRELAEETGLQAEVREVLGVEAYDLFPVSDQLARRHFIWMQLPVGHLPVDLDSSFNGQEHDAQDGIERSFTCFWIPLAQAHVLAAGFSAQLGALARRVQGK